MDQGTLRYAMVISALAMWALSFPIIKFGLEGVEPLTLAAVRFIIPLPVIYLLYRRERMPAGGGGGTGGGGSTGSEGDACSGGDTEGGRGAGSVGDACIGGDTCGGGDTEGARGAGPAGENGPGVRVRPLSHPWNRSYPVTLIRTRSGRTRGRGEASGAHPLVLIFAFSVFNVVLPNVLQNYGMLTTPAGVSGIIQGSGPIFTIILAAAFLHERLGPLQIAGIALALAGSLLLVSGGELTLDGSFWGKVLILGSALSYAVSGVLAKITLRTTSPAELTFRSFLIGGAILTAAAGMVEGPVSLMDAEPEHLAGVMFVAIFPTCLAFIFWYRALQHLPLSTLAISVFLIPLLAVILSWLILGEAITPFMAATGSMVIAGVVLAQLAGMRYRTGPGA